MTKLTKALDRKLRKLAQDTYRSILHDLDYGITENVLPGSAKDTNDLVSTVALIYTNRLLAKEFAAQVKADEKYIAEEYGIILED
jgi:hypothetical protein